MARTRKATLLSAAAVLAAALLDPASTADAQGTRMCCFNNWRYAGTCIVQIAKDQQCGDVLSALNNPMDVSTYCAGGGGGSNVRGGWAMLDCGGGGQTDTGGTDRARTPQRLDTPPEPSEHPATRPPETITPGQTSPIRGGVQAARPTFIQPVQPSTLQSDGPTVITLR